MKSIKILALAALAAFAAMAIASAGTASATTLCKVIGVREGGSRVCPEGQRYPKEIVIKAKLKAGTKAVLQDKQVSPEKKFECEESEAKGKTKEESAEQLPGQLEELTFKKCVLRIGENTFNCTVEAVQLPYHFEIQFMAYDSATWTFSEQEPEGGKPGALIKCPEVSVECTYKAQKIQLDQYGGAPAELIAYEEPLENQPFKPELGCPEDGWWYAEYEITEPNPLHETQKP